MTGPNERVFARALVASMADDVGQPPDEVLAQILEVTAQVRPLPRFIALIVEPPMVMPQRVVVGIRRNRLLMAAAALLVATSLVASGVAGAWLGDLLAPTPAPDALDRLRSATTVRVAVSPAHPQLSASDGTLSGFDVDVAIAVADRLGLEATIVPMARSQLATSSAEWDVALPTQADWSLDRDVYLVTDSYYAWRREVLVPADSGAATLPDVQGQPMCAIAGDAGAHWLLGEFSPPGPDPAPTALVPSTLILRDSDDACLADLADGTVRAVVSAAMSRADLADHPELRSIASLPPEPRAIVVRRAGPDPTSLLGEIERALDDMRRDGTLARLSTERFGENLTMAP